MVGVRVNTKYRIQQTEAHRADLDSQHTVDAGVVSESEFNKIARSAAGDARVTIGALRVAARTARQINENEIIYSVLEALCFGHRSDRNKS